jgi:ferredoxin
MKTTIFYYTGTGNSLWVARTLAGLLGDAEVISISDWMREKRSVQSESVGVVFPVHIWGVPHRIIDFVGEIKAFSPRNIFAIAVDADQVANTLVQLEKVFKKYGMTLLSGYEIRLPSNYIPWGGAEPKEKQEQKFMTAKAKLSNIALAIKNREKTPVEKGPLWQRIIFTLIYKLSFSKVPAMDGKFWVDKKCIPCTICGRVCPAENITMIDGKPTWNHRCEQCLACIQWCPEKAIQYGNKTSAYERYHHPEIQLKDMVKGTL